MMTKPNEDKKKMIVSVETKRIQTYLFHSPLLKAMLGANVRLGETMRGFWDENKKQYSKDCLARLVVEIGKYSPPAEFLSSVPVNPEDPLAIEDNPARDKYMGILTRDAGRFTAVLPGIHEANIFIDRARLLLAQKLPGVRCDFRMQSLADYMTGASANQMQSNAKGLIPPVTTPEIKLCKSSGVDPAIKDENNTPFENLVGRTFLDQLDASQKAYAGEAFDVMSRITAWAHKKRDEDNTWFWPLGDQPGDFSELAPSGYMAVIHADGNNLGKQFSCFLQSLKVDEDLSFDEQEKQIADFFRQMRSVVRCALVEAIQKTFSSIQDPERKQPFRVLMVAGDDLLICTDAKFGLPFARHYAEAIRTRPSLPGNKPFTVGVGIVIAKAKFPFFRLHEAAEELASSAKRLIRGDVPQRSVVDWLISTDSNMTDLDLHYQQYHVQYSINDVQEHLLLTRKPMAILRKQNDSDEPNLESLLDCMEEFKTIPRNKRRAAAVALFRQRETSSIYIESLQKNTQKSLANVLAEVQPTQQDSVNQPWFLLSDENDNLKYYSTSLYDLVQIAEIDTLGQNDTTDAPTNESTPGTEGETAPNHNEVRQ